MKLKLDEIFGRRTQRSIRDAGHDAQTVVLRIPRNPSLALLESLVAQFLLAVGSMPVEGKLWIVEPGRVRIHQGKGFEEG